MIVKRRLGILKDLLNEFRVTLHVTFIPTQKNKADGLTRVCKEWLTLEKNAKMILINAVVDWIYKKYITDVIWV